VVQIRDVINQLDMGFQQSQTPAGVSGRRRRTGQCDQPGLDLTGHRRGHWRFPGLLPADRGIHVTTGIDETLRDQPDRLRRHPDPISDHLAIADLTHTGIEFEQHPRTHDHPGRVHTRRGDLLQHRTVGAGQRDDVLLAPGGHDHSPCPADEMGRDLPDTTMPSHHQKT
jgi:hypothetical protein